LAGSREGHWRLLPYEVFDGATNMAIDEAILEEHLAGRVPPTLRFYGFNPPAMTIGYSQRLAEGTEERAKEAGIEIVRRPTGGRAVLHVGELTYSFVGSDTTGGGILEASIAGAYKQICRGLQLGLLRLGVPTELGKTNVPYRNLQDCFHATTGSDLHYQGKKIAGSAQLRRRHGVLQHGSILLEQEQDLLPRLLGAGPPASAAENSDRHANVFEICGSRSMEELQDCLRQGFEEAFGITFDTVEQCALTSR
jgi:lipoate-protein ligase A